MASEPQGIWGDLASSAFVQASPLFRMLDDDARADLLRVAEQVAYRDGEVVVRQGEPGDDMFLIREGSAVVRLAARGAERDVAYLDRGAVFGEMGALGRATRLATVAARGDLLVIRFPGPVIVALASRYPKLAKMLGALVNAREHSNQR
jgi:CRP-like cAMP-binding protein